MGQGAVANDDLKLCRSRKDGNSVRTGGKLKAPEVTQKSFELERKRRRIFPSRLEKGTNELSFFTLEGKIEQRIRISVRNRLRSACRFFATPVSSLDFFHRRLRNRPNRQQKQDKVRIFSLFYSKICKILFHLAILSFVILNYMQCYVQRPNF